ncbi:MAG: dethiobiotin synthase [Gammaproteobacteria bacterium]|nr:dethiobiotin synthase [Gammaproteobacteria bacterium]
MKGGWFITGTDTGVGKTYVAKLLLQALKDRGEYALGMKPVASGCYTTHAGMRSEDAEQLLAAGNVSADYADINPYAFAPACAPHIAAHASGVEIELEKILSHFRRLQQKSTWIVVEGVGGWIVPLSERLMLADMARAMQLPVILVVGLRLGCLNHSLLTVAAIRQAQVPLAGWVANLIDPAMTHVDENIAALKSTIDAPLLFSLAHRKMENDSISLSNFELERLMTARSKS